MLCGIRKMTEDFVPVTSVGIHYSTQRWLNQLHPDNPWVIVGIEIRDVHCSKGIESMDSLVVRSVTRWVTLVLLSLCVSVSF